LEGGYHEPRRQQDGDGLAKEEPKAVHYLYKYLIYNINLDKCIKISHLFYSAGCHGFHAKE
jgi:hypothetical protein